MDNNSSRFYVLTDNIDTIGCYDVMVLKPDTTRLGCIKVSITTCPILREHLTPGKLSEEISQIWFPIQI